MSSKCCDGLAERFVTVKNAPCHPAVLARPLDYFMAWLARFYQGAYELNLESGQNILMLCHKTQHG